MGAWLLLALLAIPLRHHLEASASPLAEEGDTEAAAVAGALRDDFDSPFAHGAVLVISGLTLPADGDSGRAALRRLLAPLAAHPAVAGLVSPSTSLDTMLVGAGGGTALVHVALRSGYAHAIDSLRALSRGIEARGRGAAPRLALRWTGEAVLLADLHEAATRDARRAERSAFPVTALLAIWAFGSVSAAALAALGALAVVALALTAATAAATVGPSSPFAEALIPLLGVALTLDYSLYVRRQAGAGRDVARTRRTVRLAAGAVALSFASLLLAPMAEVRGLAAGGVAVALLAALVAITVGNRPRSAAAVHAAAPIDSRLRRWGAFVLRRPRVAALSSGALLAALAIPAFTARYATPPGDWLPRAMESAAALSDLHDAGRSATAGAAVVLWRLPHGTPVLSPAGWSALGDAQRALSRLPGVARVRSLASIGTGALVIAREVLPGDVRDAWLSHDGGTARLEVLPDERRGEDGAMAVVRELRRFAADSSGGARILVGGLPATMLDYEGAMRRALPWIVGVVAAASFLVLLAAWRAPVVAMKAVLLNLLVVAAATGATVLVFGNDALSRLLGHAALASIFPTVPAIAFAATFGLGLDYEIFFLGAVRAARQRGEDDEAAIVHGVVSAGRVITRAVAVMAWLFVVLSRSTLAPLAMTGFAVALALVLDATLVRLVLGPALLRVLGRWNWWPRDAGVLARGSDSS